MHRTKLADRTLPNYTRGEEIMNMVTHIVGGALGILVLLAGIFRSIPNEDPATLIGSIIYGCTMVALYTISSVYHGLHSGIGKRLCRSSIIAPFIF